MSANRGGRVVRSEMIDFAVESNRTNVLLVEATMLQEEAWGK